MNSAPWDALDRQPLNNPTQYGGIPAINAFVDSLGVPADSVQVWIQETPPESWGQGGKLTADR
jgi:hypothetical protein